MPKKILVVYFIQNSYAGENCVHTACVYLVTEMLVRDVIEVIVRDWWATLMYRVYDVVMEHSIDVHFFSFFFLTIIPLWLMFILMTLRNRVFTII